MLIEKVHEVNPVTGATTARDVEHGPYRARLRSQSGHGEVNMSEVFAAQNATFEIAITVPVKAGWQLRHIGGLLYNITAPPAPSRKLRMQTLTCQRTNE